MRRSPGARGEIQLEGGASHRMRLKTNRGGITQHASAGGAARMEQRSDRLSYGIDAGEIRAFVAIAAMASPSKIQAAMRVCSARC